MSDNYTFKVWDDMVLALGTPHFWGKFNKACQNTNSFAVYFTHYLLITPASLACCLMSSTS